ncbi:MAG: hypothetical protein SFV23_24425 [Planctomycetaceae bacterium]|nr:hypothetical protein [Planctomycetaceae bacterium]
MLYRHTLIVLLLTLPTICGCGAKSVPGGTKGILLVGGAPMSELQINVHATKDGTPQTIGFGVTAADGSFLLYQTGASSGLWLTPGEYRFTLESLGAPTVIPKEFTSAATTPWKVQWTGTEPTLNLELPAVEVKRK